MTLTFGFQFRKPCGTSSFVLVGLEALWRSDQIWMILHLICRLTDVYALHTTNNHKHVDNGFCCLETGKVPHPYGVWMFSSLCFETGTGPAQSTQDQTTSTNSPDRFFQRLLLGFLNTSVYCLNIFTLIYWEDCEGMQWEVSCIQ